jgi:hypothetical protein
VEGIAPRGQDQGTPILRGKYQMVMEAGVSRGHEAFASTPFGVLAMADPIPVVSLVPRSTTGYRLGRLRRRRAPRLRNSL